MNGTQKSRACRARGVLKHRWRRNGVFVVHRTRKRMSRGRKGGGIRDPASDLQTKPDGYTQAEWRTAAGGRETRSKMEDGHPRMRQIYYSKREHKGVKRADGRRAGPIWARHHSQGRRHAGALSLTSYDSRSSVDAGDGAEVAREVRAGSGSCSGTGTHPHRHWDRRVRRLRQ